MLNSMRDLKIKMERFVWADIKSIERLIMHHQNVAFVWRKKCSQSLKAMNPYVVDSLNVLAQGNKG